MAKSVIIMESQEEYNLYSKAHSVLSEEMEGFFEDDERREEIGEDVVDAIITIKNPDFVIRSNFAEQWENLGMEDWEWNHLFGSLISNISPTLIQQLLVVIEKIYGDLSSHDEENIKEWVEERITDNLSAHIPYEVVMEINMQEYVDNYKGSSNWIKNAIYDGLGNLVSLIKKSAIKEAAIMLINNQLGD